MIMQWMSDFRHAWRALFRTPGFLVTSVATLAIAIGAVLGAQIGGRVGRKLPATIYRVIIVIVGIAAIVSLLS